MTKFAQLVLSADTRELRAAKTDLQSLTKVGKETETQTDKTSRSVDAIGREAGKAVVPVRRLRDEKGRYVKTSREATAATVAAVGGLSREGAASAAAAVAADKHTASVTRSAAASGMLAKASNAASVSMLGMVSGFAGIVAASLSLSAMTGVISDFDTSMSAVAAVTRATGQDLMDLRDIAKDLGATTEFTSAQAADGLKFLGMAGFTAKEAIAAIPDTLNLATAAQMDLATAADIASNVLSGFGMAARDAGQVADVLAAASSRSNTSVSQLGQAMSTVAPISKSLGISVEDTAAAIGVLSDAGVQGERAGTAMRGVLASLAGPTDQAAAVLNKLGLTIEDVNPQTNDLDVIFRRLKDSGMSMADAIALFGREAATGGLIFADFHDRLGEFGDELGTVDGEAQRMADTIRDNLGGDLQGLGSAISGLVIALGEAGLTGALRSVVQTITGGVRYAIENLRELGVYLGAAAVVITATYIPAIYSAISAQIALAGSYVLLNGGIWGAIAGLVAFRGALIATGIGALIVLVGYLANAFLDLADDVGGVGEAFNRLKEVGAEVAQRLGESFSAAGDIIGGAANYIQGMFLGAFATIARGFARLMTSIAQGLQVIGIGDGVGVGSEFAESMTFKADSLTSLGAGQVAQGGRNLVNAARPLESLAALRSERARANGEMFGPNLPDDQGDTPPAYTPPELPPEFNPEDFGSGGGGSGGRSGGSASSGKSEMQKQAEKAAESIKGLRQEYDNLQATIGMTAEEEKVFMAVQELGTEATAEQIAEVQLLVPEIERLKEAKERLAESSDKGKAALEGMFGSILDGSKSAKEALADLLIQIARVQALNAIFAIPGMGGLGQSIGSLLLPSFDGGGSTGNGPRVGGVDGMGGFPAILHPQEVIYDTSKGQSPYRGQSGQGETSIVQVQLSKDLEGRLLQQARDQSVRISESAVGKASRASATDQYLSTGKSS